MGNRPPASQIPVQKTAILKLVFHVCCVETVRFGKDHFFVRTWRGKRRGWYCIARLTYSRGLQPTVDHVKVPRSLKKRQKPGKAKTKLLVRRCQALLVFFNAHHLKPIRFFGFRR